MTSRFVTRVVIYIGLIVFFLSIFLRGGRHHWKEHLVEAVLFTSFVPVVFWLIILPPVVARWYLILLIPWTIYLGALLYRRR